MREGFEERLVETGHGAPLQIRLLGGFRVEIDGAPLPDAAWSRQPARTLVKLLALEPTHRLHRERILELLWPDANPDASVNAFRKALHAARQALEPERRGHGASSYLLLQDDMLALASPGAWIDVEVFERAAEDALRTGEPSAIDEALRLYGGELLPGDRYEDWAAARRERLLDLWSRLVRARASSLAQAGDPEAAAGALQELLALDPTREDVHRELMRLYLASGSRHAAMRQYRLCRDALQAELSVEPEAETRALYEAIMQASGVEAVAQSPLPAFLRRDPPTPLMGRQRVVQALTQALDAARQGQGSALLLSGEAGIGKSRLAADLARETSQRGALVLWGAGLAQGGDLPYGLFLDALHRYFTGRPESERQRLTHDHPELAHLIPGVTPAGDVPVPPAASGYPEREIEGGQLLTAILDVLSTISAQRPLLLVLDDIHGADGTSLCLLEMLLRETAGRPWLVCATYRLEDVEAGSDFHRLVTRATREGLCSVINLLRLSREDADALARSMLPGATAHDDLLDYLWSLSLGNPLFLGELIHAMQEHREVEIRDGRWQRAHDAQTRVPQRVQDLVVARVYGMGREASRVLTTAAVIGMEMPFTVLRAATGMDDLQLLDVLDQALGSWILEERDEGYAFRHPLVRSALYESLSAHRRKYLHGEIGRVLERLHPDSVDVLAYHFLRNDDEDRALTYLERAGDRARAIYANETARGDYQMLIVRLDRLSRFDDAARVRCKLAEVLAVTGSYAAALEALGRALQHYTESGNAAGMAHALARAGRTHWVRGSHAAGLEQIEPLLPYVEEHIASVELSDLWMALAHLYYAANRMPESLHAAERAGTLARRFGAMRLLAEAEVRRAGDLWMLTTDPTRPDYEENRATYRHTPEEILQILRDASALAEEHDDLHTVVMALHNLAVFSGYLADFETTECSLTRLLEIDERMGNVSRLAHHTVELADLMVRRGDWSRARRNLERAAELIRPIESSWQSAYPFIALALLDFLEGRRKDMEEQLREAAVRAERDDNRHARRVVVQLQAERDLEDGRAAQARARLEAAIQPLRAEEVPELIGVLALAYAETGDVDRAEELMGLTASRWERQGLKVGLLEHLVVQGRVLLTAGKRCEAMRALDRALELAGELDSPYLRAEALYYRGLAMDMREGRRYLEEALEIFRQLGARPAAERAEAALTSARAATIAV